MEKLHIIPHDHKINKQDRNNLQGHRSLCLWFTGFSGSGKSTLAGLLEQELYQKGYLTYILDGDNVRAGLNKDLDFSDKSRTENIRRIAEVSKLFTEAGVVVLSAFISPFHSDRQLVKDLVGEDSFVEIFVDCPIEVCEQRDVKGLYQKARAGQISNFTGINSAFEVPLNPTVTVQTHLETQEQSIQKLLDVVLPKLHL